MGIDFTVITGSPSGALRTATGHRDVGPTQALVKITHSGVCGTDEHYRKAGMGLGHEGIGVITELGRDAAQWADFKVGDRVGMGWIQKYCGHCRSCLKGLDVHCLASETYGTANHDQGTFSTGLAVDVTALVHIPDAIASEHAGPLMCGGATVWGPLAHGGVQPGDRVGVVGVGGLGHLAIQFAAKMGLAVTVFSGTESKRDEAIAFGATTFVATAGVTSFDAMAVAPIDHLLITTSVIPDLGLYQTVMAKGGKMYPLTISFEAPGVPMLPLVVGGLSVVGSAGCNRREFDDMLAFCVRTGVRPQIQTFKLSQEGVTEAMEVLKEGKMRYRGVVVA